MEVFAVFKKGKYYQGCAGIFPTQTRAIEVALQLAAEDEDDYHTWEVVPFELDTITTILTTHGTQSLDHKPVFSTQKPRAPVHPDAPRHMDGCLCPDHHPERTPKT